MALDDLVKDNTPDDENDDLRKLRKDITASKLRRLKKGVALVSSKRKNIRTKKRQSELRSLHFYVEDDVRTNFKMQVAKKGMLMDEFFMEVFDFYNKNHPI